MFIAFKETELTGTINTDATAKVIRGGVSYTLNTIDRHAVCYAVDCRNLAVNKEEPATLQAKSGGYSLNYNNPVLYEEPKETDDGSNCGGKPPCR